MNISDFTQTKAAYKIDNDFLYISDEQGSLIKLKNLLTK